jgi:hypothetical protein
VLRQGEFHRPVPMQLREQRGLRRQPWRGRVNEPVLVAGLAPKLLQALKKQCHLVLLLLIEIRGLDIRQLEDADVG